MRVLTEVALSENSDDKVKKSNPKDILPNITEKSLVFAPFNTTLASNETRDLIANLFDPKFLIIYSSKVRDANR
jgi:hypothetical protein